MINSRGECKLGRLEGVVCGEMDVQEEHTTLVWRLRWTENSSLECTNFVSKSNLVQISNFLPANGTGHPPLDPQSTGPVGRC